MPDSASRAALPRFVLLYTLMYGAFGSASPFLPAFLGSRGVSPDQLGLLLAAGTGIRLLTAPLAGRIGDRLRALRPVLAVSLALAAGAALAYGPAHGLCALLIVSLAHSATLAPTTVLADALALRSATPERGRGFEYGWVRGTGSAAFILGTVVAGQTVKASGIGAILGLQAALLAASALAARGLSETWHRPSTAAARARAGGLAALLRLPAFRRLLLVAGLVLGSHAMHDGFAVIRWREAGIGPGLVSLLWSEAVAAEVLVFFLLGPALLRRLTPAAALAVAAAAGLLRWAVLAETSAVPALALVQPLHGCTFALLHLACMRVLVRIVPPGLEGSAQAVYGTVGIGLPTALLTLASGHLYGRFGARGFWAMAALCALALPVAWRLRGVVRG